MCVLRTPISQMYRSMYACKRIYRHMYADAMLRYVMLRDNMLSSGLKMCYVLLLGYAVLYQRQIKDCAVFDYAMSYYGLA